MAKDAFNKKKVFSPGKWS